MEDISNKLTKAGDVTIELVEITASNGLAQNITPQVVGVVIYESLFEPFITGELHVRDSQQLSHLLPLIGEETVRIKILTPEFPSVTAYEGEFYIFKMEDQIRVAERESFYVLHFISREAIADLNTKISRGYSGSIDKIAESIIKGDDALQSKKRANIEPTSNTTKFVSNFWSPIRCLQFMVEQALNENDSPSYIFFENKFGLNFLSLDSLYDPAIDPMHIFKRDNYTNQVEKTGGMSRSLAEDYARILDINTPMVFNYMDRLKTGMYGSEIIYYDLLAKQYVHKGYQPDWKGNHLNEFPLWTPKIAARPKAVLFVEQQYYNNFDGYGVTANTKTVQQRAQLLANAIAHKCTISVMGRTDYSVAQKVYLEIPKTTQIADATDTLDAIQSGKYIIAAICHSISRTKYTCSMDLIKDSYIVSMAR